MVLLVSISSIVCLVNWSSEETSVSSKKRLAVNFYGTLTTWKGEEYSIDNIAIGHLYKQIALYEPPAQGQAYTLTANPTDGIITKIDLVNVKEIKVPHPDVVWTYQKSKNTSKHEYIELVVISTDKTRSSYLIDTRRKVTCNLVRCKEEKAVSEAEKEAPFKDIQSLVITGHLDRDASESERPCPKKK